MKDHRMIALVLNFLSLVEAFAAPEFDFDWRSAVVSSTNGIYQAAFDLTNCIVRGGTTNWSASFTRDLFRSRGYVSPEGEFVIVAHEQPVLAEDLHIEICFRDGGKLKVILHEGEPRPMPRPRTPSRISHLRPDEGKNGIYHLFEVVGDQVLIWCPARRKWTALEVTTGKRSVPTEEAIRLATEAFVIEAANFLSQRGRERLPIFGDFPQMDSRAYSVLFASLARREDLALLISLMNTAPGSISVEEDFPLEVKFASQRRTEILEILGSYWKLNDPPVTIFDVDSKFDPAQLSFLVRIPEDIHVSRLELELRSSWLPLTKSPFLMRQFSDSEDYFLAALAARKHSTIKVSVKDVPRWDYDLSISLRDTNRLVWVSKPVKVSLTKPSGTPVVVGDFVMQN